MAEQEQVVVSDEEYSDLICQKNGETYSPLTSLSENLDWDHNFVFSIDQSLLIDPLLVKIGKKIGEGPNSTVYKGLYKSQPVAVKVLEPARALEASAECKLKFQREVIMLSKVKHDNIVKFIGASYEPSLVIVTELMSCSLQKYMWETRPATLDLKLALTFALEMSRAMEYMHANGIIHRDLKPGNMLLTEDKKHIKLIDFGTAREEISGEMTSEAGTYRWMAPEIFSRDSLSRGGKLIYDHKVDVYSFSIVLWEIFANQTPFKGRSNVMVAYAAAKRVRPDVDEIPSTIGDLLQSCWADDPDKRPEFREITECLSNIYSNLFPTENTPPPEVVENEHPKDANREAEHEAAEVIPTQQQMHNKSEEKCEISEENHVQPVQKYDEKRAVKKRRRSYFRFLRCFCFN
ncbi:hypothetical protein UlMin_039482 [Ulmus minor]